MRELNDVFIDRDDGCGAGVAAGIGADNEQGAPLEVLRAMTPQLESARKLRLVVLEIIESGKGVPMRAGKINLAWLAGTVGLTRQVFYPGRGGEELSQIADLLLEHVQSQPSTKPHTQYDKSLTSLRTEIQLLRTQLHDAERALQRSAFREEIIRSGKILTF